MKKHREATKMERQSNIPQIKEQKTFPEKEINEMEASNLQGTEVKTSVLRMLKELRRIDEISENLDKEIESIKRGIETIQKN